MITIQRVRVRWGAAARGAQHANARRGLSRPAALPSFMPADDVVIHEVLADEATRYTPHDQVISGGTDRARDLGLWLSSKESALVVDRLPGHAAYPRQSGPARLFTLLPGQIGRYRANFRYWFTTCPCNPSWYYEDWHVLIANGAMETEEFISREPDQDADHRVHLYGGSRRPARR
ncbi:hypothetical protein FB565_007150 [Actinoplanes lutulentus]|uniref:Uncharacterized protein n=1 Tax=Actinoplanes lutulentus TaxID=1287878 RepID=A0A327ZD55_9ACTN|nr:hypothetical protein [Actinoplanes lutulentus]MBB2947382.1 hypothetical protein [Actinoplanes lutulentus]RAK36656.1 hypothetical protein B0I29_108246 [Actinoplanes lutulentus]